MYERWIMDACPPTFPPTCPPKRSGGGSAAAAEAAGVGGMVDV
ncbi:MAG TPA: hypothetical protein VMT35_18120 [Ignavibacteriaceae bacterium]|nr:hypothetical protein [Ignavibacteriaceae bacterium]